MNIKRFISLICVFAISVSACSFNAAAKENAAEEGVVKESAIEESAENENGTEDGAVQESNADKSNADKSSAGESGIKIVINGEKKVFDQMPILKNGRVLVPMRGIFEALGAAVDYDDETGTVTGRRGRTKVVLTADSTAATVNGEAVTLDVPATVVDSRTLVPIRFIGQALGKDVDWDEKTNTVSITDQIKPGMAELKSTFHREIPTELDFKRSNRLDDLIFAPDYQKQEDEGEFSLPSGKEVYSPQKLIDKAYIDESAKSFGGISVVDVEGQEDFNKALNIDVTKSSSNVLDFIVRTDPIKEDVTATDKYLLTFKMKTVKGGDTNGNGRMTVIVQTGAEQKWAKAVESEVFAGKDWVPIYIAFSGVAKAQTVEFRPGSFIQTLEMADFKIIKLDDPTVKLKIPESRGLYKELSEGAAWRDEALERIEKIRKGDFKVVVKDSNGNAVPDAKVTFNMFEHEFLFGSMGAPAMTTYANEDWAKPYAPALGRNFNTMVAGVEMKWYQYVKDPNEARKQFELVKGYGIKNFRGHTLFWPISTNRTEQKEDYLVIPPVLFDYLDKNDRESFDKAVKENIFTECAAFPDVCRWDVVNEIGDRLEFFNVWGADIYKKMFDWARQATPKGTTLVWNDYSTPMYSGPVLKMIGEFKKAEVDYDTIGIQTHMDVAATTAAPTQWLQHYNDLVKASGKNIEVTEFSAPGGDSVLEGQYLRDMAILAFSFPYMEGFTMWGHTDHWSSNSTPLYGFGWREKPGLEQWADLVYNKWWTRNEETVTDKDGEGSIRGFYGDYDVTVNIGGEEKTVSAAFHKGYENVLTITVD